MQFGKKVNFGGFEIGVGTKYFILKPLKNTNMTIQNFFSILQNFFLKRKGDMSDLRIVIF